MDNQTKARCAYCGKLAHRSTETIDNPHAPDSPEYKTWAYPGDLPIKSGKPVSTIRQLAGNRSEKRTEAYSSMIVKTWVLDEDPFCSLACLRSFATEAFQAGVRMQGRAHV